MFTVVFLVLGLGLQLGAGGVTPLLVFLLVLWVHVLSQGPELRPRLLSSTYDDASSASASESDEDERALN